MTLREILHKTTFRVITDSEEKFKRIKQNILYSGISPYTIEMSMATMIRENPSLGCNTSQIDALANYPDNGFLCIVEDDIEFSPNFSHHILDLPLSDNLLTEWDTLYLGISNWGYVENSPGKAKLGAIEYDKDVINTDIFVRVKNMFSTHAILYLNSKYADELREIVKTKTFPEYIEPNDLSNARGQINNYCAALRVPMFYQKGHHEYCTKIEFNDKR